jgi:pteridine reductase
MADTALITGASKRIGRMVSEYLAENGWNVIIHYNFSEKEAKDLRDLLEERFPGQMFRIVEANLANLSEVEALIPELIAELGEFNLLVNNASLFDPGYIKETDHQLFADQIDVNLRAPFFLMRDFAHHCKKGNIINFTDTRITKNKSDHAAYSLSKKALWELTKMAALEFAPDIRVNAIAPGVTLAPEGKGEEYLWNLAKNIPMKKPVGLEPILRSMEYILNNHHLTGQLLFADGGENLGQNV